MGSGLCPQISVIPSSEPEKDALIFTKIFSGFSRSDFGNSSTSSTTTLLASSNNSETIVVFCKVEEIGSAPSVLILYGDDNRLCLRQLRAAANDAILGVEVLPVDTCVGSDDQVLLRFAGGGSLLAITRQKIEPSVLVEWIVGATAALGNVITDSDYALPQKKTVSPSSTADTPSINPEIEPASQLPPISTRNGKAIMNEISSVKIPIFPTLEVTLNGDQFPLNTPEPVSFENDLFRGKIILLLRPIDPPKDDPYWNDRIWAKRRRRFLLQIQGKFKRQPRGTLFVGAEVSEPMKLGLLAKGVCNLLLKFLTSFARDLHYSFGDDNENGHISAPAWTTFQNIVVTKPGKTPPPLGDDIDESKESLALRASADASGGVWNTTDTFTMSYHSMYLDLPTWQVVKLPFAPSLDLRTFWGKSLLSICIYDTPEPKRRHHFRRDNGYYVSIQLKFLGLHVEAKEEEQEPLPWSFKTRSISEGNLDALDASGNIENGPLEPTIEEVDGEDYYFFDAEELQSDSDLKPECQLIVKPSEGRRRLNDIDSTCPFWIDVCSKGKYVTLYAVNVNDTKTVLRYESTFSDCFDAGKDRELAESVWSPRLSESEKTRRIVGQVVNSALANSTQNQQLQKFVQSESIFDSKFLRGTPPMLPTSKASMVQKSAFVARALSDHHWVEEWMKVTHMQLAFYHPDRILKANLYLSLNNLLSVRKLAPHETPSLAQSYSFMEVQTLGQTVYLMFASGEICDSWVAYLLTVIKHHPMSETLSDNSGVSDQLISVDNPSKEFLHKSSMWNCKQRRILNCRKFSFHSSRCVDALSQVEDALTKALEPREESEERNLCTFLDSTAALKQVDVSTLSEAERTAFFLNLYHVMIVHAFLVLGPPDSTFKWMTYFNTIAYQCSDEIFSLTELEHNIIRASMSYPSQFVSRFVLPKSQFSFALTGADFRINFALNCGSMSNPVCVPVYKASTLDRQLDASCEDYLKEVDVVAQKRNSLIVTLPRVCAWFAEDFGDGSSNAVLRCVEKYLKNSQREMLAACWDSKNARYNDVSLRHLPFSFTCRTLFLCVEKYEPFTIE